MTNPPNPQYSVYASAPTPRKRRAWPWVLGILVALVAVCGGGAALALGGAARTIDDSTKKTHTITYTVTGKGTGSVTYIGDGFSESQEADTALPWSKSVTVTGWQPVVITAQLGMGASGTITCEIDVDGVKGKPVTSSGQFAVVSCSADTLPKS